MRDSTAPRAVFRGRTSLVRPPGSRCAGHSIPDRRKIGRHVQMRLAQQQILHRTIKVIQGFASRHQVQWITGLQRAIYGCAQGIIDIRKGPKRFKKSQVRGGDHRLCLSLFVQLATYRGPQ